VGTGLYPFFTARLDGAPYFDIPSILIGAVAGLLGWWICRPRRSNAGASAAPPT
jgi:hypothetical protein